VSGNPTGRAASIERRLRDEWERQSAQTGGPSGEFVTAMRGVMLKGKRQRDRVAAGKLLMERTFGYPREDVTIQMLLAKLAPELAQIPTEELARELEQRRKERDEIVARLLPSPVSETEH